MFSFTHDETRRKRAADEREIEEERKETERPRRGYEEGRSVDGNGREEEEEEEFIRNVVAGHGEDAVGYLIFHIPPLSPFLIHRLTMMNFPQLYRSWQKKFARQSFESEAQTARLVMSAQGRKSVWERYPCICVSVCLGVHVHAVCSGGGRGTAFTAHHLHFHTQFVMSVTRQAESRGSHRTKMAASIPQMGKEKRGRTLWGGRKGDGGAVARPERDGENKTNK
ncbi:hypothetical protein EYF80_022808 [Liparis tanakae]|uniref:Uncharacterized protein n=1 Tax=Liparis tanakae TaxID=230148 RepID=A0A4Z2HP42_9TELE|nr:hypothetical protein EYF80_022808 [Liparis tanakae]